MKNVDETHDLMDEIHDLVRQSFLQLYNFDLNTRIIGISDVLKIGSSIHVYLFCLHVVHFRATWMTSCVQFEIIEG